MKFIKGVLILFGLFAIFQQVDIAVNGPPADAMRKIAATKVAANVVPDPHRFEREQMLSNIDGYLSIALIQAKATGCLSTGTSAAIINGMRNGAVNAKECKLVLNDLYTLSNSAAVKYADFITTNYGEKSKFTDLEELFQITHDIDVAADNLGTRLGMTSSQMDKLNAANLKKAEHRFYNN